jgi:hypothetical protein
MRPKEKDYEGGEALVFRYFEDRFGPLAILMLLEEFPRRPMCEA